MPQLKTTHDSLVARFVVAVVVSVVVGAASWAGGSTALAAEVGAADVTVSASTQDLTPPVLTSVATTAAAVIPGQQVVIDYAVTDQTAIRYVQIWVKEARTGRIAGGVRFHTGTAPPTPSVTLDVDHTWTNGRYAVSTVEVSDTTGNRAFYQADGTVTDSDGGRIGSHALALGSVQFTVSGSTADYDPPALTKWAVTDRTLAPGQRLSVSYAFDERKPRLTSLMAVWTIDGIGQVAMEGTDLPTSGTLSTPTSLSGIATLDWVAVREGENSAHYDRDGTLYTGQYPSGRHSIDFSAQDVAMGDVRKAPAVTAVAGNGSATVRWQSSPDDATITAYTVSASPGGQVKTLSGAARSTSFTGLTNGTTNTFSVVAVDRFGSRPAARATATPRPWVRIVGLGDFNGDWHNDIAVVDQAGALWLYKGNGRGGFLSPRVRIGSGWQSTRVLSPTNGPLIPQSHSYSADLSSFRYDGTHIKYPASGAGTWDRSVPMPGSWAGAARILGAGDWTGDGQSDLMSVDGAGALRLHRATGYYTYASGSVIGSGWGGLRQVFAAGDFSGDLRPDLMAVAPDGGLYLYRGNGKGGWSGTKTKTGSGWQGFRTVFSPGDFTGDDRPDVIGVTSSGDMYLYRGNGKGGWSGSGTRIGTGWGSFL